MTASEILNVFERTLMEKINSKTGWGKDQLRVAVLEAKTEALGLIYAQLTNQQVDK